MGAWGTGSFENDTAMDWADSVQSVDDVRKPFERLKRDTDAHGIDPELVVDSDFACELIAAAETVAMMLGRRIPDYPQDLAQRLAGAGEPDSLLFHQARNAALYAMRNSELPLSTTITSRSSPRAAAVASSCPFIRKSPSPDTQTTGRSWKRSAAATAAGRP
jgi:hypothetical protein